MNLKRINRIETGEGVSSVGQLLDVYFNKNKVYWKHSWNPFVTEKKGWWWWTDKTRAQRNESTLNRWDHRWGSKTTNRGKLTELARLRTQRRHDLVDGGRPASVRRPPAHRDAVFAFWNLICCSSGFAKKLTRRLVRIIVDMSRTTRDDEVLGRQLGHRR